MLTCNIDRMVELLKKNKYMDFSKIAKKLSWEEESVEKVALILEKAGLAMAHYPINMIERPYITLLPSPEDECEKEHDGKIINKYEIYDEERHVSGDVKIRYSKDEKRPVYTIALPTASRYVRAYLEDVKVAIARQMPVGGMEHDPEVVKRQFEVRYKAISDMIANDLLPDKKTLKQLSDIVINEMYGLGRLEALIGDKKLEEIIINSSRLPVSIYHREFGWMKTNIHLKLESDTSNYAQQIARRVGKQISTLHPILDAHLSTGDRVNATLRPISARGNTITLRLFARNPWTITSFLKKEVNSMSLDMAALLWQALHYEMNVLVAGGTASGKTSALNALLALIQPFQRIVTIEDTRELMLPSFQWNWIPLVTRLPNPEGFGEVTVLDLLVNSLRMRPDRIVMGEIRRKREAEVFFEAMHTGHSVYSTVHADTGTQVIKRLIEPPIEVPASEIEDVHLVLVQYRDRRKNIRRTLEISEMVSGMGGPELNRIFAWKPRTDKFEAVRPPHRFFEDLNLHTGMTESEAKADQRDKIAVLKWMLKKDLNNMEDVGKVMKAYYADESGIVKAAKKDTAPSKVLW